ncbi:HupE/UreJ family protein [Tranquillimonas alkanivorans]|uniref:Urease accessory protein n=1 Tax=Tranquillimonas alkanivorans TaxID=441119 RepID=A0A1I5PLJ7_9RHOB|nr:HupE/UreJ family protein [Tranquillimonas alkanivorans]SFP34660.1 urease accessory protein [Tranquillimonas alkanivorans]
MKKLLAPALALTATPALAHHPLGGMEMTTFAHGVLSGVGHPILGFDHLFFVALMGIAAVFTGRAATAPLAYIAAMIAGVVIATFGPALPLAEAVIAVSLLALGGVVLSGRALSAPAALALFAGFGLFHGSAFGGAMASAEAGATLPVLAGYLLGLAAIQYAVARAAGWVAQNVWQATDAGALQPRLAGAVVAGVGLFLSLETVEGALFASLGWG